jgi:TetR/AcrR family transcriptional regulator
MSDGPSKSRRERERERHRQEILDAARKVVEARGVAGLTVDEVAREAEFAVGSIYRHFGSKEELLELLVAHVAEPLGEEIEAIAAADVSFEDQLRGVVQSVLDQFSTNMVLIEAYHTVSGPPPSEGSPAREHLRATRDRWVAAVEQVLRRGQEDGVVREGDPRQWAVLVLGLASSWSKWTASGELPGTSDPVGSITSLLLDGVRER